MTEASHHQRRAEIATDGAAPTTTQIRVRWSDLDPLGHVTAAVFVTFIEEGRDEWLHDVLGDEFATDRYVMARVEIDYRAEIPLGTRYVETRHRVVRLGRSSVTLAEQLLRPDGTVAADCRAVLVMWDPGNHTSRPLTEVETTRFGQA